MPLTPADVRNVAFSKLPIGKRGYNEDEVDAFLDLVEAELARLIEENDDLREQVSQLEQRLGNVQADLEDARSRPPAAASMGAVSPPTQQVPAESSPPMQRPWAPEQTYTSFWMRNKFGEAELFRITEFVFHELHLRGVWDIDDENAALIYDILQKGAQRAAESASEYARLAFGVRIAN